MKETFINIVLSELMPTFNMEDIGTIRNTLILALENYEVVSKKNEIATYGFEDEKLIKLFLVSKKIDGLAERSIKAYKQELESHLHLYIKKRITDITTDDLRMHFAKRMIDNPHVSKTTLNNERLYMSSFFTWLTDNGHIIKNPMRAIKKMKEDKKIKKAFTQEEIEIMRDELKNKIEKSINSRDYYVAVRSLTIFEFLLSTGCRISELTGAKLKDLDIANGEVVVLGKGSKERMCYLNEISIIRLKQWMEIRNKRLNRENPHIFISYQNSTRETISVGSIEAFFRKLGNQFGIKCHPHKFRRTCATTALSKGMPIEEVKEMLGHNEINTTMIYAQVSQENVKHNHRKYM